MLCDGVVLMGVGTVIQNGPSVEDGVLVLWESALAPGSYFKAVLVLPLPSGTVRQCCASSGLGEVGAVRPSVHRRGQDVPSPVLQANPACFAATGPGREV